MATISVDELVYATQEVAVLLKSPMRFDVTVHERLRALIREQRSAVRTLIVARLKAVGVTQAEEDESSKRVTAAELKKAGLTLKAITARDATLTGQALITAGVIATHAHLADVGITSFVEMLDQIGSPAQMATYLRIATGSEQAWQVDFVPQFKFDFDAWLKTRARLKPADLCQLNFFLGAQFPMRPGLLAAAATEVDKWLPNALPEEWTSGKWKQLTPEQYNYLVSSVGR